MTDCGQLLRRYVEEGSEEAFDELVRKHINLVYSTALRQVGGDAHFAQDVTQSVFSDLARKARKLGEDVVLAGWLYRHTVFTASKMVRAEQRRKIREQHAVAMTSLTPDTNAGWEAIAPLLDEAMNALGGRERDAMVLRFFQGQDLRTVGAAFGVSEDAAQKRVTRAIDKLRRFFSRRGIEVSGSALATLLSAHSVAAAPAGAITAITTASLTSAAAGVTFGNLLIMAKLKTALGLVVIAGVTTPLVLQYRTISTLRAENDALRAQAAIQQPLTQTQNEAPGANEADKLELMRLRAQVSQLRTQQQEIGRLTDENKRLRSQTAASQPAQRKADPALQVAEYLPREQWMDAGHATPQAALQTMAWAISTGNAEKFKQSVFFTDEARQFLTNLLAKMGPPEALAEVRQRGWGVEEGLLFPMIAQDKKEGFQALRVRTQDVPSPDEIVLNLDIETAAGTSHADKMRFRRIAGDWRRLFDMEDLPVNP